MAKSKQRATLAAEKLLRQAIAEETLALQSELTAANQRIAALQGALQALASNALAACGEVIAEPGAAPHEKRTLPAELAVLALPKPEIPESQEPPVDLAGEDNLGSGRWI